MKIQGNIFVDFEHFLIKLDVKFWRIAENNRKNSVYEHALNAVVKETRNFCSFLMVDTKRVLHVKYTPRRRQSTLPTGPQAQNLLVPPSPRQSKFLHYSNDFNMNHQLQNKTNFWKKGVMKVSTFRDLKIGSMQSFYFIFAYRIAASHNYVIEYIKKNCNNKL